ncbi:hypothetical protein [Crossiella sp. CA198]|uniref:hypothetical protein n=1 Tax=Crossiella sp. CA198 TaxID=3455607 RepID=UPI003F8D113C
MRRSRLVLLALATVPAIAVLGACQQASAFADKAKVCTEAINLATLQPNPDDPQQTRNEAKEKADRLIDLTKNVAEADLKGALTTVADHYTSLAKEKVDGVVNLGNWAKQTVQNLNTVRKVCLG